MFEIELKAKTLGNIKYYALDEIEKSIIPKGYTIRDLNDNIEIVWDDCCLETVWLDFDNGMYYVGEKKLQEIEDVIFDHINDWEINY